MEQKQDKQYDPFDDIFFWIKLACTDFSFLFGGVMEKELETNAMNQLPGEDYSWLKTIMEQESTPMTKKQKAIVKAAVELFSEKGYAATSTKEIAKKAGVAEGLIFKQYPTKKDLMLWITKRIINTALFPFMSSGISELLTKPYETGEELLNAFLQNRIGLFNEGLPLFKIILQELPFQPEVRSMFIEQIQKLPFSEMVEKINPNKISGFSKTDIIQLVWSSVIGFFFLRNIIAPELFPKNQLQEDVSNLARFINNGLHNEEKKPL
jgi:AcrR family transcriptional regulator